MGRRFKIGFKSGSVVETGTGSWIMSLEGKYKPGNGVRTVWKVDVSLEGKGQNGRRVEVWEGL